MTMMLSDAYLFLSTSTTTTYNDDMSKRCVKNVKWDNNHMQILKNIKDLKKGNNVDDATWICHEWRNVTYCVLCYQTESKQCVKCVILLTLALQKLICSINDSRKHLLQSVAWLEKNLKVKYWVKMFRTPVNYIFVV